MSEQLTAASQAMGIPESLVERSARARATETGQSYEDVLAAWAGGEAVAAAPSAPPEPAPETDEASGEETPPADAPVEPPPAEPAQPAAAAASAEPVTRPPAPATVTPEESLEHPVVVTVPTAGITERTGFAMPAWLGALLLIVPAFGLIYLALGASNECGTGTELAVDRVTGLVENCDGSPFEGRGGPGGGADFIAAGGTEYATCAGCHGANGEGGVGPAMTGVLTTFGSCADHIEWVALGSEGFRAEGRSTYGDTGKPVTSGMPPFAGSLSEEQLASVVAFERVRFGGGAPDEVLADCGLVEGEEGGAEGEEGAEGEGGAEGQGGTQGEGAEGEGGAEGQGGTQGEGQGGAQGDEGTDTTAAG